MLSAHGKVHTPVLLDIPQISVHADIWSPNTKADVAFLSFEQGELRVVSATTHYTLAHCCSSSTSASNANDICGATMGTYGKVFVPTHKCLLCNKFLRLSGGSLPFLLRLCHLGFLLQAASGLLLGGSVRHRLRGLGLRLCCLHLRFRRGCTCLCLSQLRLSVRLGRLGPSSARVRCLGS